MIIGHAAGVAADLALKRGVAVHDIPISDLQKILMEEGGVFEYGPQHQLSALAKIRERFTPPRPPAGRAAWDRPPPAGAK